MALNDVSFQLGQGGLGRPLPGEDYISGIVFYNPDYFTSGVMTSGPAGFTGTGNNIKEIFQVADAEALGIVNDYSDETPATGSVLIGGTVTAGDSISISVVEPTATGGTTSISIGSYTCIGTDTTATIAAALAASVNAQKNTTGYSASVSSSTVTITARPGLGVALNTGTNLVATLSSAATVTATLTQFSGGVNSFLAIYHYHISEYFRIMNTVSGQGSLYVGFFSAADQDSTWPELASMQSSADGKIRQLAIYNDTATYSTLSGAVQGLQTAEAALDVLHQPFSILYTTDFTGESLASLPDLSALNSSKVSVIIGQDGAALGWSLFKAYGKSISCIGAALGAVSAAAVSEDIAWVGKFNLSDGTELDTAAFAEGSLFRNIANSELTQIDNERYIFLRKFIGQSGTYFNDSHCAVVQSSDYAYIENNRTIDKAKRGMYVSLLPALNSPLTLNADGTLADTTISYLETLAEQPLQQMQRDGDLSNFQVTIDATQNVLSTSTVKVNALLQPRGVARNIQVIIGFTTSTQ